MSYESDRRPTNISLAPETPVKEDPQGSDGRGRSASPSSPTIPTTRRVYGARNSALRRLGFETYKDYLNSPHWRRLRDRYFQHALTEKACICGEEIEVDLHHLTYERIGREELDDLRPLCRRCHSLVHVLERRGDLTIDLAGLLSEQRAEQYAAELEEIANGRQSDDLVHLEEVRGEVDRLLTALPLGERLREIQRRALLSNADIRSDMRLVNKAVERMQRRVVAGADKSSLWKRA